MTRTFLILLAAVGFSARAGTDYLEPRVLTGTIYRDATLKQALFNFRRTTESTGTVVTVSREYTLSDGSLAARERVVYDAGQLRSFHLDDLRSGARGSAVVSGAKVAFQFSQNGSKKSDEEKFQKDMLIGDMIVPFVYDHWDELMKGAAVKCRLVALSRTETVGFKFVKEGESTCGAKPVVLLRLEPSSPIIAAFVEPIHFVIEKGGAHHVLQYSGRTTPSIRVKGKWEDLDAVTVFHWNESHSGSQISTFNEREK